MSNVGAQQLWVSGSKFVFQRDAVNSVEQPLIDLGSIEPMNPTLTTTTIRATSSGCGVIETIDEAVSEIEETYELTTRNFHPDVMALLFQSTPVEELTQASTPVTGVKHWGVPGRLVKVSNVDYDAAGYDVNDAVVGIASIDAVKSDGGGTTYTEDTDWEVVDLERGIIRIIEGGAIAAAAAIDIDFTPRAISGERLIKPFTATSIKGNGMITWCMENGLRQVARIARFSITPATPNIQVTDYSTLSLQVRAITDIAASIPAGTVKYYLGALPSLS